MELHNLKPAKGSVKTGKRTIGRGEGSKKGGTSTRGHKLSLIHISEPTRPY